MYDKDGNVVHLDSKGTLVPGPDPEHSKQAQGHRGKVNKGIFRILEVWGTPGAERFADDVRTRKYNAFPTIPGEKERNEHLDRDKERHRLRQETLQRRNSSVSLVPRPDFSAADEARSLRSRSGSGDTLSPQLLYMNMSGMLDNEAGPSNLNSSRGHSPRPPQDARLPHASKHYHRHENTLHVPRPRKYTNPAESTEKPQRRKMSIPVYTPDPELPSSVPMIVVEEALDTESSDDALSIQISSNKDRSKNKSV